MSDIKDIKQAIAILGKGLKDVFDTLSAMNDYNRAMLNQLKEVHQQIIQQQDRIQAQLHDIQQNQIMKHDDVTIN